MKSGWHRYLPRGGGRGQCRLSGHSFRTIDHSGGESTRVKLRSTVAWYPRQELDDMIRSPAERQSVFRVHAADAGARAQLVWRLNQDSGVMVVDFPHDRLPDSPWPELTDPRVRVAFVPARRAASRAHFSNPSSGVVSP